MKEEVLEQLLAKYLEGRASIDEINQLEHWYDSFELREDLYAGDTSELRQLLVQRFMELKDRLGIN